MVLPERSFLATDLQLYPGVRQQPSRLLLEEHAALLDPPLPYPPSPRPRRVAQRALGGVVQRARGSQPEAAEDSPGVVAENLEIEGLGEDRGPRRSS